MVVVVAVAAALVLSGLLLSGLVGSSGASSGGGNGTTFSTARGVADQFASEHGTWDLLEGVGFALPNATQYPLTPPTVNATCMFTAFVGTLPTNLTFPAFTGSLTSGAAPVWLFGYYAPGVGNELAIFEVEGSIAEAVDLTAGCTGGILTHVTTTPTSVVDSSVAVAAAAAAGGTAFLSAHPTGVELTMILLGGFLLVNGSTSWPTWSISWSTCSALYGVSPPSSGDTFSAAVNGTTGVVVPSSPTNSTCGSTVPPPPGNNIGNALLVGVPNLYVGAGTGGTVPSQGCTSGDYCYSVSILSATMNITPADFTMSVVNFTTGQTAPVAVGFAILDVSNEVIVSSPGPTESAWTPGVGNATTLLAAGMTFTVDLGTKDPSAANYGLVFTGQGPFADSSLGLTL
jgi:hypothetical protein